MSNLKELKMEGNNGMVYPPVPILSKEVSNVLDWCELKLASSSYMKRRNIIQSVQGLLEQVDKYKLGGSGNGQRHEAVFEANVAYNQGKARTIIVTEMFCFINVHATFIRLSFHLFLIDKYYQFLFPLLWSDFVPKMEDIWSKEPKLKATVKTFPYERHEVEKAIC